MTYDNFDDWFKNLMMVQGKVIPTSMIKGLESQKEQLRVAWEAGWDAGKLYEQLAESERQGELGSLG